LSEIYSDFLSTEGFRPTQDPDGDLVFKKEGRTYLIICDDEDPTFFRLVFPNFWSIESDAERLQALTAAQEATADTKVAKVFLVKDNVWASVELFVADPAAVAPVFERSMGALESAVNRYAGVMRAPES
jgi:hypothetical protein